MAANRADLLDKKLSSITKYYLCSEHFSDDCFADPPNNTRLNKTLYPTVSIPVPTIFKCNFNKYIPSSKRNSSGSEFPEDGERSKKMRNYGPINDFLSMNRSKEGISMESLSVFHDHYNYPDISSCSASFFNDISVGMNDLSNDNSFDNIVDPLDAIRDEMSHSFQVCRLCAKAYSSGEHLRNLSSEPGLYDMLATILPNQVNSIFFRRIFNRYLIVF